MSVDLRPRHMSLLQVLGFSNAANGRFRRYRAGGARIGVGPDSTHIGHRSLCECLGFFANKPMGRLVPMFLSAWVRAGARAVALDENI